jgi:hypothetical protein
MFTSYLSPNSFEDNEIREVAPDSGSMTISIVVCSHSLGVLGCSLLAFYLS